MPARAGGDCVPSIRRSPVTLHRVTTELAADGAVHRARTINCSPHRGRNSRTYSKNCAKGSVAGPSRAPSLITQPGYPQNRRSQPWRRPPRAELDRQSQIRSLPAALSARPIFLNSLSAIRRDEDHSKGDNRATERQNSPDQRSTAPPAPHVAAAGPGRRAARGEQWWTASSGSAARDRCPLPNARAGR